MDPCTLMVELGARSYPIIIGSGLLAGSENLGDRLPGNDCLIVSNSTVAPLYAEQLESRLAGRRIQTLVMPDGERFKTIESALSVIDALVAKGAGRDTTVIALGGGVVGDIAGFAAACYMRGVGFVQVPTTLLAQVDSSVGGKTGVNHPGGKNLIGAFHQPIMVVIDTDTLETLPDRELKAGIAEIIKYGAIIDADFFAWLEDNMAALVSRDPEALAFAIRRSCEIKAAVVADDEREAGSRALLNFGHTFGHAIENSLGYGEWLHGEAVAAGMIMAAELSGIEPRAEQRLRCLVEAAGLPVAPPPISGERLRSAMKLDKKNRGNALRFVLLDDIGKARVTATYSEAGLRRILDRAGA